ncbi:unnamed protein product [Paramecium sonneborni]|uniref:RING-type domain-containing protein n=1 Tax=Paramecium sonneborni TaxID=65129 RepID=A0A8S1KNZ1_9CILI|nr:unnamed protein product [Paramecium sonneborni]
MIVIYFALCTENWIMIDTFGLQQINLSNYQIDILSIQANFSVKQASILMICDATPNFTTFSEIYLDQNFQCICDWNAFEFTGKSQKLMLFRNSKKNYNSYSTNTKFSNSLQIFIGIFSQQNDILNILISSKQSNDCLSICKNNGQCVKNICDCLEGYFGFDCEFQGFDILKQDYLEKDILYYLDSMKIGNDHFFLQFSNEVKISYQCFLENPYLRKAVVKELAYINITIDEINKCQRIGLQSSQIYHYIIIQSYQDGIVYINQNLNENENHFQAIIISVISIGLLCLCCFILCIFKFSSFKIKKAQSTNNINIIASVSKNQNIFESSFDWNQLIPAIEYQSLLRKIPQINDQIECQICLDTFKQDQFVRVTYCMHVYHYKCFDRWMKQNLMCPICRSPQDKKAIDKIQNQENLMNIAQSYSYSSNRRPENRHQQGNKRYGDIPILTNSRTGGSSKLILSH